MDAIPNTGRLCGLMIKVKPNIGLAAAIDAISIQLSAAATFDIYIYHSSQAQPISVVNYVSNGNGVTWQNVKEQLDAFNDTVNGGVYYITYYQDDLTTTAIPYKQYSFKTGNCSTCQGGVINTNFERQSQYFEITPFYVGSASLDLVNRTKFNESAIITEDFKNNYGFNLKLAVRCDLTQFFIDNKLSVADAIISKITIKILEQIFHTKNINQTSDSALVRLQIDLFGDATTKEKSFNQKYKDSLKMLNLNFSSINNSCIKCLPEYQQPNVKYNFF